MHLNFAYDWMALGQTVTVAAIPGLPSDTALTGTITAVTAYTVTLHLPLGAGVDVTFSTEEPVPTFTHVDTP